jgi:hypothetical protein
MHPKPGPLYYICRCSPRSRYSQPGLVLWQNLHILIWHPQKLPHIPPPIAAKERFRFARLIIPDPEPWRPERAVLFIEFPRRLCECLLILRCLGGGHDVDDLGLCEMFVQGLGHVCWDGDVNVLYEAVFPESEVGELVLFAGEGVLDVDHASLGLCARVSARVEKVQVDTRVRNERSRSRGLKTRRRWSEWKGPSRALTRIDSIGKNGGPLS